jgi:N-acetylmuramoyl-L-alanine amidase
VSLKPLARGLATLSALMLFLGGCANTMKIDSTYTAVSQDSRVQHLIIHFTTADLPRSLKILTQGPVSSHYLVSERQGDVPAKIYQLVDENRRAFHAGVSSWKGATALNASSIGIEIVNLGGRPGINGVGLNFQDFEPEQIDRVVELVKDIVARHQIRPDRILGHSDIAPSRKNDPGPKFPWKRLADAGLIPWPDAAKVAARTVLYSAAMPSLAWFQDKLAQHGFTLPATGEQDKLTTDVLSAFQQKYRPARFDGLPDAETAAILDVLTAGGAVAATAPSGSMVQADALDAHQHWPRCTGR